MPSYEGWVSEEQSSLLRIAWMLTGDRFEAEDLVQDTLVRCYLKWARMERADNPAAYGRTVMFNVWRNRRHRPETPTDNQPDHPHHSPDSWLTRATLVAALARLSPMERAAVALRHVDDLSVAQTARILGSSEQSVKTHTMRALAKLRDDPDLAPLFPSGDDDEH